MTGIIDYGMGNIHSVHKALESLGEKTLVTNNPEDLKKINKVVLPGVGAFDDALAELKKNGLYQALKEYIGENKIFLGICLGMQILFETSQEAEKEKGLSVFKGAVLKFPQKNGLKVPHMGWNQLKKSQNAPCPLLKDIKDGDYVYFCHSYYPAPQEGEIVAATTSYGMDFVSIVWQENVYGVQFHPEKSQETGLKILKNFIKL